MTGWVVRLWKRRKRPNNKSRTRNLSLVQKSGMGRGKEKKGGKDQGKETDEKNGKVGNKGFRRGVKRMGK